MLVGDASGNAQNCTVTVQVVDNTAPTVVTQPVMLPLAANGEATITAMDVDNGSSDNCTIDNMVLDRAMFSCADVGTPVSVTLTVTDVNGNSASNTALVTVVDNTAPTAVTQPHTVDLNASGTASITANDVDGGSNDNCSVTGLAVSPMNFTCSDIGDRTVTLTVTDASGNTSQETATVTVRDVTPPSLPAQCGMTITKVLNASGTASASTADLTGISDNCDDNPTVLMFGKKNYTCADAGKTFNLTVLVGDASGNAQNCTVTVQVVDNTAPTITENANLIFDLDANGDLTLAPADVATAADNCSVNAALTSISQTTFDCSNLGNNTITFSATDVNGNSTSQQITIEVRDVTDPVIGECTNNNGTYTVTLSGGTFTLDAATAIADLNITDECTATPTVQFQRGGTIGSTVEFTCADTGAPVSIGVQVLDGSNNPAFCFVNVTVVDGDNSCTPIPVQADVINSNGSTTVEEDVESSSAQLEEAADVPTLTSVRVAPNPVRTLAIITYTLAAPTEVEVYVLDFNGQRVDNIYRGLQNSGNNVARWTLNGNVPAGLYLVVVETAEGERKLVRVSVQ